MPAHEPHTTATSGGDGPSTVDRTPWDLVTPADPWVSAITPWTP